MSTVRLRLLGDFELLCGLDVVTLPPGGQQLMAFLAIHDRPVSRPYIYGTLWPDTTEDRAAANLRSSLWRVGRCGAGLVSALGPDLGLGSNICVDLHEISALATSVRITQAPLVAAGIYRLIDADDLLPDWDEDWLADRRELFRHLRVDALEYLCERLTVQEGYTPERYGLAADAGFAAVADEPLRESAHRALIRLHLSEGNRTEAARQYRLYRTFLSREVGVEPSRAMMAIGRDLGL